MNNREKVIRELESLRDICNAKSNMAFGKGKIAWAGYANAADDALALLKEQEEDIQDLRRENHKILTQFHEWEKKQEAKPPAIMQDIEGIWSTCSMCGHKLRPILAMEMDTYFPKFCSECGQVVKWK